MDGDAHSVPIHQKSADPDWSGQQAAVLLPLHPFLISSTGLDAKGVKVECEHALACSAGYF
jgi:hypothetical protein